ncbi:MAG: DNA translocase FtsK 4TM domain-containing protein [Acidobacteriota bacterium]|nr:DNA translocase FtsK 4TM domain-containing protein [Acidobacteriota bacterium]
MAKAGASVFALILLLSLFSYYPTDPMPFSNGNLGQPLHNLCGTFGAILSGVLMTLVGSGSWLVPVYILWECWVPATEDEDAKWLARLAPRLAWISLAFVLWTSLGALGVRKFSLGEGLSPMDLRWGGWLGSILFPPLHRLLGWGLPLVMGLLFLLSALILAPALTRAVASLLARWMGEKAWPLLKPLPMRGAKGVHTGVRGFIGMVKRPFLKSEGVENLPDFDIQDAQQLAFIAEQQRLLEEQSASLSRAERESAEFRRQHPQIPQELSYPVIHSVNLEGLDLSPSDILMTQSNDPQPRLTHPIKPALLRDLPPPRPSRKPLVEPRTVTDKYGRVSEQQPLPLMEPTPAKPLNGPLPTIHSMTASGKGKPDLSSIADRVELPPRRLFDPPTLHQKLKADDLEGTRDLIGQKLAEFKVKGLMVGMQPGPVVTVYEFQPDPGVPLAKVLGMEEDLALALKAEAVRIDRIPGKNLVGIEVPNAHRETITFREVLDSPAFRDPRSKDGTSLLLLAMGKDIAGTPIVADLARMPHLLIGGSTGSGKSVGVNAMICSILMRALPSEVKLILVDPKMVELGVYENIPHLWAPVVTDMKEAGRVLKWVVAQMEDRYRRLALLSVRNLEQFNAKISSAGGIVELGERTPNPRWLDRPTVLEPLPFVVVVIDELADLMMVARSEVEDSIARIAQKARAVGIHLVLATQRPSVDIVTGVIKANLPSRLSYRVNTKIDSRTILDSSGGEQLLGKGDALFLGPGSARPHRIHAPFLTEEETLGLVTWLKERGRPDYNQALMDAMEADEEQAAEDGTEILADGDGDIYVRAVAVVRRERKASTSLLQRKLNIGYGRAARLIDRMEDEGIVGPDRGAGKPREVLVGED